jgi:dUTP pyrophosphatase
MTAQPDVHIYWTHAADYETVDRLAERFRAQGFPTHLVQGGNDRVAFDEPAPSRMFSYEGASQYLTSLDSRLSLELVVEPHGEGLPLPDYETPGASAMDLRAAIPAEEPIHLLVGQRKVVPTGLSFAIPPGYEVQVRGRSGLAARHGIGIVNGVGTIDSDYRGELCVILINHGQEAFAINRGDRIAQMVVAPVVQARWTTVEKLSETARGTGGFGSTGRA